MLGASEAGSKKSTTDYFNALDDLRQVWRGQNQEILITPQEPINVPNLSNSECRKFEFTFEEMGTIKRGSGVACKDGNKNWRMLGEEML